jgi:rhodanese-related sulfurtransferase
MSIRAFSADGAHLRSKAGDDLKHQLCSTHGRGSINYEELRNLMSSDSAKNTVLVDVRNPDEYVDGHIPEAINLPLEKLEEAANGSGVDFTTAFSVPLPDKNQAIVLSCLKGKRASKACEILVGLGYTNVRVYHGSFKDWKERGGRVDKCKC